MKLDPVGLDVLDEGFIKNNELKQALMYYWDRLEVVHQKPQPPKQINLEQLVEGLWFGERSLLHLFRTGDKLLAVYGEDSGAEQTFDEPLLIDHRRSKEWGRKLLVRHYLERDEDGQYHDVYVRPVKLLRDLEETEVSGDE